MKNRKSILQNIFVITGIILLLCSCTDYDYDQADTPANQAGFERHTVQAPKWLVRDAFAIADKLGLEQLMYPVHSEAILTLTKYGPGSDHKPFLAEGRFVSSEEELRIWDEVKKNESSDNHG